MSHTSSSWSPPSKTALLAAVEVTTSCNGKSISTVQSQLPFPKCIYGISFSQTKKLQVYMVMDKFAL